MTRTAPLLARLMALTAGHRWLIPLLVLLGLLAFLFEGIGIYLLMPLLQTLSGTEGAATVDGLVGAATRWTADLPQGRKVAALVGAIVGCILLKGLTALASQMAQAYAGARFGHDIRVSTFRVILGADQGFLDVQPPGALLNTLATETWRLSQGLQALSWLILNGCAVVIFLGLMLVLSWQMTLVVGTAVGLILLVVHQVTAPAKAAGAEAVRANQTLASRISEGLAGLRTIRLFAREPDELHRFTAASSAVRRAFLRMEVLNALPAPLMETLFALLLGGLLIWQGTAGLPSLLVFLALLVRLQPHAAALMHARVALMTLEGAMDNVADLGRAADLHPLPSGPLPAVAPAQAIRLAAVGFRHAGAQTEALSDVTAEIPAGRTTAVVGPSGAGKSTLLGLVCRLADPTSGAVLIDGQDLRRFDLASWRRRIAVVPQDVFLFNASLRDNIAYGRPDATKAEIVAAAKAAFAYDFIAAVPAGYETHAGDRGQRFSGGQRQRLALARAILAAPDVLILDEATNALDGMAERLVQDALDQQAGRRTVIVVAHRLSSVERADHVILLDHGRVAATGSPDALWRGSPLFRALFGAERRSA
jgi:subfamily B ATP-binding cassette protein MsbA